NFEIRVEHPGFKIAKQQNLTLDVGEVRRLDFTLEIGEVTDSVVVLAEPLALNLEKGEISAVVTERKIVDLPLNGDCLSRTTGS
ncbi:MAG: carboxypeptidase-like regulatory domain-containing protein, partial [Acidobacteria bacterium]|nr:carboxypeptidase-like regulatory domain-containing protein [Acidobacteriota bacterium]